MASLALRHTIPRALVALRAILGPLVVLAAWKIRWPEPWLGGIIAIALLSDIYDGVLARRWGTLTSGLRSADSIADTVFYVGVLIAVILRHEPVLRARIGLLGLLLLFEAIRMGFDWMKFRRMASYHTYTAKVWGLLLAGATIALLCFDRAFWLVTVALVWGIVCDAEGLAISFVLPAWAHDVKTFARALALRTKM